MLSPYNFQQTTCHILTQHHNIKMSYGKSEQVERTGTLEITKLGERSQGHEPLQLNSEPGAVGDNGPAY